MDFRTGLFHQDATKFSSKAQYRGTRPSDLIIKKKEATKFKTETVRTSTSDVNPLDTKCSFSMIDLYRAKMDRTNSK